MADGRETLIPLGKVESYTPPAPGAYFDVFVRDATGVTILEHLQALFYDRDPFVKGGPEGERETLVRLGERRVVEYLHRQIAKSRGKGMTS